MFSFTLSSEDHLEGRHAVPQEPSDDSPWSVFSLFCHVKSGMRMNIEFYFVDGPLTFIRPLLCVIFCCGGDM